MMETAIVKLDPKEFGLEKSKASEITKGLANVLKEKEILCEQYIKVVKLETTKENVPKFRELRLLIRDNRTKGIEAWHKVNKEYFLRGGQFVDAIKRKESEENNRMEEQLLKGEKHFELMEAERKEKLKDQREKALEKYEIETELIQLGGMTEEVWLNYFNGVKLEYDQRVAAEKKIEEERIAKEKITKLHNDRKNSILDLWQFAEPELKTANLGEINNNGWSMIVSSLNQEKIDYDNKQEEIEKENKRLQKETEAKGKELKKQTEATAKIGAELQAKKDDEIKAETDSKEAEAKEARQPDKKKLIELAERFKAPKLPEVKSEEAKIILKEVAELCNKISIFITEKSTNL